MSNDGFWSERRADLLTQMWAAGVATKEIGRQLNRTKNAVIGKAHRIGLDYHPRLGGGGRGRKAPRVEPAWWEQLRAGGCSYDLGDSASFNFCGEPARHGSAFCRVHHEIA
jgi:hypothetical protein